MLKACITIIIVLLLASGVAYQQFKTAVDSPLKVTEDTAFEVKKGTGFNQLCAQWQHKGWLEHCFPFQLLAKLDPSLTDLKAGYYQLTNSGIVDNIRKINRGEQLSFSFTIIEGQSLREVVTNIARQQHLVNDLTTTQLAQQILGEPGSLEGWLFPDTYHFHKGDSASELLKRAAKKMRTELQLAWQNRVADLPLNNAYEALILASIIEKETGLASERPMIASVFINRLNNKMRLQTDPTVIYGLGERYDGDIKRKDLRELTPYNTYRIDGLPPTPIAMPSKAALLAAVDPAQSNYFYFVAKGVGDGSHQFSTTLQQHNVAVKNYLLNNKN